MSEKENEHGASQPTILVVDDEPANIFALKCMLEGEGYRLDDCATGYECLDKVRQTVYGLVLLDVMLPDLDGYEVCARIGEMTPDLPVVLVTALTSSEDLAKGFDAGAVDYIKKPLDHLELLARVRNTLRIFQAESRIKTLYGSLVEDLKTAARMQHYMLPQTLLRTDRLMYSAAYAPSERVGGDLYDVIRLDDNRWVVYMGDVSGHGIQAALLMSAVKFIINMLVERADPETQPYEIVNELNRLLPATVLQGRYVTLLLACVDLESRSFVYYNAGHPSILLYDMGSGDQRHLDEVGSIPIGWNAEIDYREAEQGRVTFEDHKALVLYTDGVTECEDGSGVALGLEGLKALITSVHVDHCPMLLPHRIKEILTSRAIETGRDDFSILALCPPLDSDRYLSLDLMEEARQSGGQLLTRKRLLSSIGGLCRQVSARIEAWCGDEDLAARADIVLAELLANVVVHGLNDLHDSVFVTLSLQEDTLHLRIVDTGAHWDPTDAPASVPQASFDVDHLKESGRGLEIVRALASSIKYTRICDANETVLTLPLGATDRGDLQ